MKDHNEKEGRLHMEFWIKARITDGHTQTKLIEFKII